MRPFPTLPLLFVLLVSCVLETDRERYAVRDEGEARFTNRRPVAVFLEGCSFYSFEHLEAGRWADRGSDIMCIWEGFAQPLDPGETLSSAFSAPEEPGLWRLRSTVGLGCSPQEPLSPETCRSVHSVYSDPFAVESLCEPQECGPPLGMPNWLCPDGSVAGPTDRCLRDEHSGLCGWEIASC